MKFTKLFVYSLAIAIIAIGGFNIASAETSSLPGATDPGAGDTSGGSSLPVATDPGAGSTAGGASLPIATDPGDSTTAGGPVTPSTPSSGGATAYGGGSAVSSGTSTTSASTTVVVATTTTSTFSCPLISTFMNLGGNNNGSDVSKLQAFLKNSEKLNVNVNGTYDQTTFDAVRAFQDKYLADTMGPWGAAISSGRVYITTLKKVNQLACASPLSLSAEELAIINAYKANVASGNASTTGVIGQQNGTTTPVIGSNGSNANTAAAANAPILQRIWNFIKNLF
jgi:hypothetical protein